MTQYIRAAAGQSSHVPVADAFHRPGFAMPSMTVETTAMRRDVVRTSFIMQSHPSFIDDIKCIQSHILFESSDLTVSAVWANLF